MSNLAKPSSNRLQLLYLTDRFNNTFLSASGAEQCYCWDYIRVGPMCMVNVSDHGDISMVRRWPRLCPIVI